MTFLQFISRTYAEQKIKVSGYVGTHYFELPVKTAYEFWVNDDLTNEIQRYRVVLIKSRNDIITVILDDDGVEENE